MIVVNSRAGQRSNRLVTIAHAMATAIEHGETLRLTAFSELADDYVGEITWPGRVVLGDSALWEIVRLMIALCKRLGWRSFLRGRVISDWEYRNPDAVEQYAEAIRAYFRPARQFAVLDRQPGEVIVGVHKRRGDYRKFLGGCYYYEDDVYDRNIQAVRSYFEAEGKRVLVLVFPKDDPVQDQWTMSQCDCLIGPPSSFSAWASFMGRIPLALIWNSGYVIKREDIRYRGLYV